MEQLTPKESQNSVSAIAPQPPLVLVTGPSGAGRTTAINVLEDLDFEAIDNLPLRLVPALVNAGGADRPLVLGLDPRNRDFSTEAMVDRHAQGAAGI